MDAVLRGPFGPIPLGSNVVSIGRTPDNQVVVNDPQASSRHAEIRLAGQGYVITDAGSASGTFVNNQRLDWNVPRMLNNGDTIRIGGTMFNYEVRSMPQYGQGQPSSPGYEPTVAASPPTSYGSSPQQGYPPPSSPYGSYTPPQPQSYAPPPPSSSYDPTVAQPYTPSQPQQPYASPPPPSYGNAQQAYTPSGGIPYPPPTVPQQKKRSNVGLIVIIVLVVLVILGSVGIFFVVRNNQIATQNANATATANSQTVTASNITATVRAKLTATAVAQTNATATVVAANPNPYADSMPKLALYDPLKDNTSGYKWNEASGCAFSNGEYHASETDINFFDVCYATAPNSTFSTLTYRVEMRITQGDAGGIAFRANSSTHQYYFFVLDRNGFYAIVRQDDSSHNKILKQGTTSAVKGSLGDDNIVAIVASGSTMTVYVNNQNVSSADDSTYSSGEIGVLAFPLDNHATEVAYSFAKVWTS